jgi:hypothetical protein
MTVLIVGNSVSLPPVAGVPSYAERLASLVAPRGSFETVIKSGETIEQMEPDIATALARQPERLVVQVGINECAPRPLSVSERERLGRLRPARLRGLIIRGLHRFRPQIIRARRLHQFTPLPRFAESISRVLAAARQAGARTLILPITSVTSIAESRTPFTNREVARYNAVLAGVAGPSIDIVSDRDLFGAAGPDELCVTPESVHLSAAAHQRIAEFLAGWLDAPAHSRTAYSRSSERAG